MGLEVILRIERAPSQLRRPVGLPFIATPFAVYYVDAAITDPSTVSLDAAQLEAISDLVAGSP